MQHNYKVILADDHAITRGGLKAVIEKKGCVVVSEAESFPTLMACMSEYPADLVISDCKMDGDGPVNFLYFVKRRYPEAKVVFLSGLNSGILFSQLFAVGADGLVSKQDSGNDVVKAIESVMSGKQFISPSVKLKIDAVDNVLTKREFQILELIAQGKSNVEISEILSKAKGTVNAHRVSIMRKLGVHSVVDLVHFCRDNELFDS